ncbi:hypothetical protein [Caulobacter sp. CCUG 60055]|uniref:hypothetical protein n=1 Tax=Caulobacter sp. CCUG 60055 TaxID=2100090 RepID=UPI001FA76BD9|nr:hypothetical protein [Caulobacter sp. CCUG 60055]MBQ1542643.1 hypothetical protein [Caulobacteraceae bacterium]
MKPSTRTDYRRRVAWVVDVIAAAPAAGPGVDRNEVHRRRARQAADFFAHSLGDRPTGR